MISAAVFALSHAVLLESPAATVVFFPGLIFGWLYCRTESLLAPILFHGLANVCYGLMAVSLNQALIVQ
jgi:membrane protease YdiL (CAAX protease family)